MGTRGLTCVIRQAKPVVAQYGQWDHYPSGQGTTVLNFCLKVNSENGWEKFIEQLDKCRFVDSEELHKLRIEAGANPDTEWVTNDVTEKFKAIHPALHRDMAAEVLEAIYEDKVALLKDSYSFAADSLFCEWCYVIDLDKNTFEVYQGFNHNPLPEGERFADLPKDGDYYPVRLLTSYSLDNLPTEEQFLKDNTESEDGE